MIIYDIIPPEKFKKFVQEVSGFKEYKSKTHKVLGIGWRFTLALILIISFSTGLPAIMINRVLGGGEHTALLYPDNCRGDWDYLENIYGPPDVFSGGSIDFFSDQNSAVYTGGPYHLACGDFVINEMGALARKEEEKNKVREEEIRKLLEEERRKAEEEKDEDDVDTDDVDTDDVDTDDINESGEDSPEEPKKQEPEEQGSEKDLEQGSEKETEEEIKEELGEDDKNSSEESKNGNEKQASFFQKITQKIFAQAHNKHSFEEMKEMEINGVNVKFSFALGRKTPDVFFEEEVEGDEDSLTEPEQSDEDGEKYPGQDLEENLEENDKESESNIDEDDINKSDINEDEENSSSDSERKQEAGFFEKIIGFFNNTLEFVKNTIIGFQKVFAQDKEKEFFLPDTKGIISYTLDGREWMTLDTVSGEELSNALNGGYFTYNASFIESWENLENFKISFEGVVGGETTFVAYLDSIWLEISYQRKKDGEKYILLGEKDHWGADEIPTYEIMERDGGVLNLKNKYSPAFETGEEANIQAVISSHEKKKELLERPGKKGEGNNFIIVTEDNFAPGKHKIEVEFEKDGETYVLEKDFTWGVLAVNFDKSIYTKKDNEAYIQIGVLDDEGSTICDAQLELLIKNEDFGISDYLSTENKTIKYSGVCAGDSYVKVPDYFVYYELSGKTGRYEVELTAHTKNGKRTITDSFVVKEEVSFDVQRNGPTRIYPPASYNMDIVVTANENFRGDVVETVPSFFEVESSKLGLNFRISEEGGKKKIIWRDIELKKGETISLGYKFKAPNVSPEFYLLGPLEIRSEKEFFEEERKWQIASDNPGKEENKYPTAEINVVNLTGNIEYLQYDPSSGGASDDWYEQSSIAANELHVDLDSPSGHISGEQTLRFLVRRTNNSNRQPAITIELRQDGSLISTLVSERDVASAVGEIWSYTFNTEDLNNTSGTDLEIRMTGTRTGGATQDRNVPEYGAIQWKVNLTGVRAETHPQNTTAGEIIEGNPSGYPSAFVGDKDGNAVEGVNVTVSVSGASFTLNSTTTVVTNASGTAVFDNLVIEQAGTYQLTFTAAGVTQSANSNSFTINASDLDNFFVENQPQESTAGETIAGPPRVKAEDEFGNAISGVDITVSVSGTSFTLNSTTTVTTNANGLAIFNNLVIETAGNYQLTFTADGVVGSENSNAFNVVPADPDSIIIETHPQETVAGETIIGPPTISLEDEFGNAIETGGTDISVTVSGTSFTLNSTTTVTTNANGLAIFNNLVIETAGNYQLTFSVAGLNDVVSNYFNVVPAAPHIIIIETHPQDSIFGETIEGPPRVRVEDEFGNTVSGVDVDVDAEDTSFTVGSTTTVTTNANGVATFTNLITEDDGVFRLIFTVDGFIMDTFSDFFEVEVPDIEEVTITVQPQNTVAGEIIGGYPTVFVEDQFNEPVAEIGVTVSIEGAGFASGSTITLKTNASGTVVFSNLVIEKAGIYELTFDTQGFVEDRVSDSFEIEPADADDLIIDTEPQNTVAGEVIGGYPTVQVVDEFGNIVEEANITVEVSVSGASFTLNSTTTVITNASGTAAFSNLIIEQAGVYQLDFEAVSITGNVFSDFFEIEPADPNSITIETQPQETVAGEKIVGYPTVILEDEFGNRIETGGNDVSVSVTGTIFALGSTTTVGTNVNGLAIFNNLVIEKAGNYYLTFTADGVVGEEDSNTFDIVPASPHTLTIETQPQESTAGETIQGPPTVEVKDKFSNLASNVNVNVDVSGTNFTAESTTTVSTNINGIAEFNNLVVEKSGSRLLVFTVEGTSLEELSNYFLINPGDPDNIKVKTQPQNTVAGEIIGGYPTVQVVDEFENTVEEANVTVEVSVDGASFTLNSTTTVTTNASGTAVFSNLIIEQAGVYELEFEAVSITGNVFSIPFEIEPADPETVTMEIQPEDSIIGGFILGPPSVLVEDEFGNVIDGIEVIVSIYEDEITFLGGITNVNTGLNGIARFANIYIEDPGEYQLAFSVDGIEADEVSDAFLIKDRIYPVQTLMTSNVTGTVEYLQYDPYSSEASNNWYTANNAQQNTELYVRLDEPPGHVSGTQTIRFLVRRTNNSTNRDPNIEIYLYQGTTLLETLEEGRTVTSSAGVVWTYEFEGDVLNDISGENVRILITSDATGGGANSNVGEYGAIEWEFALAGISVLIHPENTVAGEIIAGENIGEYPTVVAEDSSGNPIVDIDVTVTLFGGGDFATGTEIVATNASGTAVFDDLVIETAGTYRLIFNAEEILIDGVSSQFDVIPADPDDIIIQTQPQESVVGESVEGPPTVRLEDEFGNVIPGKEITVSLEFGSFASNSTTTVETNVNGIAVFNNLIIEQARTNRLIFETADFEGEVYSNSFDVLAGGVQGVVFYEEPKNTVAGEVIGGYPAAVLVDSFGNTVELANVEIYISVEGAIFTSGTTMKKTNLNGVATFHDLIITEAGVYELKIDCPEIEADAFSEPFEIMPADPDSITITVQPEESVMLAEPVVGPPTVRVEDEFENAIEGVNVSVTTTNDMFTLNSTTTVVTNASGTAIFNNLIISDGGTYYLTFKVNGVSDKVSNSFYVAYVYELTVISNEGGAVDVEWSMGSEMVQENTTSSFLIKEDLEVTLTAVPEEWYAFDGWSGNSTSTNEEIILTMDDDKSVTANFKEIINITGTVFTDDGNIISTDGYIIHLAINGASIGTTEASTSTGSYEFLNIDVPELGDYITVFIDEDIGTGTSGASITRKPNQKAHISNLDIYLNRVIVREEDTGGVSNVDIAHFTNVNIPFSVTTGDLTVTSGHKLIVWQDTEFTPGGDIILPASGNSSTPDGDLEIRTGAELDMESNDLIVGGSFINSGTFTVTEVQDTYFIAKSGGHVLSGNMTGTSSFGNIHFNGEGGGWTFNNNATITGNFNINEGTVTAPLNLTVGGSWSNNDIFNNNSGTVTLNASSSKTILAGGTENSFHNLTLNNSGGTWALQDDMEAEGVFNINAGTFNAGSNAIILSGSGTPFVIGGTFNEGTSTFIFKGTGNSTIPSTDYYNFQTEPSSGSPIYTLTAGTFTVTSNFYLINEGGSVTLNASTNNTIVIVDNDFNIGNNQTFSASNSLTVGASFYNNGTFTRNTGTVTFTSNEAEEIIDGGSPFYDIVFDGTGSWFYRDGSSTAPNSTVVENGEPNFLNTKTGSVTVNGGTLSVDWYLGAHVVARGYQDYNINTSLNSITISENSTTSQNTIFRHDGTNWGTASSTQVTQTGANGINPQPNSVGAIRIREYARTSTVTTTYLYNLEIDNQEGFIFYDYYEDHGGKYLTSENFGSSSHDNVIGEGWHRENSANINGEKPYSGVNQPPLEGTWYIGMESDLTFTAGANVDIGELEEFNLWTGQGNSVLTISTTFPQGYTIIAWGDYNGRMKMNEEASFISRWNYENSLPEAWDGICDNDNTKCGFGYTTDADNLPGGTANRFTNPDFCEAETGEEVEGDGQCWAGFDDSLENASPLAYSDSGTSGNETTNITYRISAPSLSKPGDYSTTIFYIATVNY